jgi:hypothetical protein
MALGTYVGSPRRPTPRKWLLIAVVIIVAVLVGAALTILATVPTLHSQSTQFTAVGSGAINDSFSLSLCPVGAHAAIAYSVEAGYGVHFVVLDPKGILVWNSLTADGNATLVVGFCGEYTFALSDQSGGTGRVNVTLSYWAPIL